MTRTLLIALALLALAAPAHAASVAYIDDNNLWLSSPDGSNKVQLTQDGTADYPWGLPSQGPDGKTVVYHRDTFQVDGHEEHRPVLYLFGPDGKIQAANVMPVYAGATAPVYPLSMDMDWDSKTVAFGYQYCGWACQTTYKGVWLTFSDQQPMNPSNPQGQSDSFFPTFYRHRIVSSDSGGRIFVQPDVAEAPFTSSYTGWLDETPDFRLWRAEVSMTGDFVGLEWTQYAANGYDPIGEGLAVGRHQGVVPSDVTQICNVPTAANPGSLTFSYDGTQMAWKDDEGVKVAGVPNLGAGTATCELTSPPRVISSTGRMPHFGGADVGAILAARNPAGPPLGGGGQQAPGADQGQNGQAPPPPPVAQPKKLTIKIAGKSLAKGIVLTVTGVKPGRIAGSASVPASAARRAGLTGKARRSLAAALSGAKTVVIARGSASAKGGAVKLVLRPTKAAKRAAKRLRRATVTIAVSQGPASGKTTLRLR
jgi:hypothetical protein